MTMPTASAKTSLIYIKRLLLRLQKEEQETDSRELKWVLFRAANAIRVEFVTELCQESGPPFPVSVLLALELEDD